MKVTTLRDAERHLSDNGFIRVRQRGSHATWLRGTDGSKFTLVSTHEELGTCMAARVRTFLRRLRR